MCALHVPLAVVNVVTPGLQTYPAEVGVGAPCSRVPDALSFCAEVVDTGAPVQVVDAREHPAYRANPLVLQGSVASYAGHPLVHRGAVVGAVSVFDPAPRRFAERELDVLAAQARLAASVLSLRWSATHDALTDLSNRRHLVPLAERALQEPPVALLFVDVDDFKAVNDRHGHLHGDAVLRQVADALQRATAGTGGLVARWGGDEFLVLLPGADADAAQALGERLVGSVQESHEGRTTITVGAAATTLRCSWDELLREAVEAAGRGKRAGKARSVRSTERRAAPPGRLRPAG